MNVLLKFDCKNCVDDVSIEVTVKGNSLPSMKEIRELAQKQGWSIGRDCYCPSCHYGLPAHCATCENYEGNKSMGASICRLDGEFTTPGDYCDHHKPRQGYKNPVPTLNLIDNGV